MPGGELSGTSHITWTEETVKPGSHYNPEFAPSRFGYSTALMRTVSIGKPLDRLQRFHDYIVEGCNEALAIVKPGVTCSALAERYCDVMAKGGYWKDSRCGYPLGINWTETSCSLRLGDKTVMTEGMVFHVMLGTWLYEDFGAVLSESFVVTENGVEVFCKTPREIIVV
ncbi:MAG: M24 family metallopeptidase [Pseudomonadota bacterium]